LRLPEPVLPYEGLHYVQAFGKSCPQQRLVLPNGLDSKLVANIGSVVGVLYEDLTPADEDCKGAVVLLIIRELSHPPGLTINVVKPSTATSTSNLPVVFVRTFLLSSAILFIWITTPSQWIFGGGFEIGGPSTFVLYRPVNLRAL
jgi:acetylcholinesterase